MHYDLTKPCTQCPFKREDGVRLRPERIEEIEQSVTSNPGGEFPCHKTTFPSDDVGGNSIGPKSQHCAGALLYAQKQDALGMVQMVRLAARFGVFNPDKLQKDPDVVWDDLEDWLENGAL